MNEEAMIYKLIVKFDISYDYALDLVMNISSKNLLEHLFFHFDEYDTFEKFYNTYFRRQLI